MLTVTQFIRFDSVWESVRSYQIRSTQPYTSPHTHARKKKKKSTEKESHTDLKCFSNPEKCYSVEPSVVFTRSGSQSKGYH